MDNQKGSGTLYDMNVVFTDFLRKVLGTFEKVASSQELKGIEKYGHAVQPLDKKWDWLNMAEEELVDAFKYLVAERERRDAVLGKVMGRLVLLEAKIREGNPTDPSDAEILVNCLHWLGMISKNVGKGEQVDGIE